MKYMNLPVVAALTVAAVWGLVACSDDVASVAVPVDEVAVPGDTIQIIGVFSSSGVAPEGVAPGSSTTVPGIELSSSSAAVPGIEIPGSSSVNPGVSLSSSSVAVLVSAASGDDENDMEDARTLDGSQILLKLAGTTATVENNNGCITVEGNGATITCPGAYYVTGEASDFQVVVNTPAAENEGNTGIYLHNATLRSSNAPILVKNADKTVLHLVKGTTNIIEDGNGNHLFTTVNGKQDTAKAAIYSKDDLNIKGAGTLTVKGNFKNGIQSSNDLKIKNGNITVIATENGVKGKGSLQISGGSLNVTAKAGDGLESDECEEAADGTCKNIVEGKGFVEISGGNITIEAGDDGVEAANYVMVSDSVEPSMVKVTSTGKGLLAGKYIYVNGGNVNVDAEDDAFHSRYQAIMNAGEVTVSSKDDGIHADSALYLKGSTVNVVTASEGLEAYRIFAEGGVSSVYATNDGWNGAGGAKENSGGYSMFSESSGHIVISGGYHYISAKGSMIDVLDANGSAKQTGGVLILEITGESYENGMGGGFGGWNGGGWNGGGMGGGSGGCSSNMAGGLIDTDTGFEIAGGVLLAFGDFSTDIPKCASVTYTNEKFYGSSQAAFKPQYHGNTILYGGSVTSVSEVQTNGMKEFKFPNGLVYMYQ